jgi:opacity protein-like surface antigen
MSSNNPIHQTKGNYNMKKTLISLLILSLGGTALAQSPSADKKLESTSAISTNTAKPVFATTTSLPKLCSHCTYPDLFTPKIIGVQKNSWWVAGSVGYAFLNSPGTTSVAMPGGPDIYTGKNINRDLFLALSAGYQWDRATKWFPAFRLGLSLESLPALSVTGTLNSGGNLYNYKNDVSSTALLLLAQADLITWKQFTPFVEFGIGPSLNHTSGYSETLIAGTGPARANPDIQDKDTTTLAYKIGTGLSYKLANHPWVFSIVYDYTDRGAANTGDSNSAGASTFGSINQNLQGSQVSLTARYNFTHSL